MLTEYALVPDIFDSTCYSNPDLCGIYLQSLKEPLLQEALVRDLRSGEWGAYISRNLQNLHIKTKEIYTKLSIQNRLRPFNPSLNSAPATYHDWCLESLASHQVESLTGIITSSSLINSFQNDSAVASIEQLSAAPWWQNRSPSMRLCRNTSNYLVSLKLILGHANSFMFIDPHLDPSQRRYKDFNQLLQSIQRTVCTPQIEIHRVCYVGSGPARQIISNTDWEQAFRSSLPSSLFSAKISVEIFIWDDFHDRYLITDIVGISMPNGFDTSNNPRDITTWTRLGRKERDDIQREFDPSSNRHTLRHRFKLI